MQVKLGEIGFDLLFSNEVSTLRTAAEAYFYLGWSVIPLYGDFDSSRPKVPTIAWAAHQHYLASLNDQRQWTNFGGLGIVTGRVSQLVVLDFDDENIFKRFKIQYPDLLETHTVRSAGRQLPHLYFKVPDHLHLNSQKGQGIDLLSNGRYVVAPPTTINGSSYTIIRGGMPKTLTERDIRRIQAFLATCTTDHAKQPESVLKSTLAADPIPCKQLKATDQDLANLYRHTCQCGGRNEALFRTSLFARDTGWSQAEAQTCLMQMHVQQTNHYESPAQRQREALATIQSAFSRPALRNRSARQTIRGQLPNSVREALMQRKMTYVIRTIEGLLLAGFKAGQTIRTQQAIITLKGLVGRDSIHNALQSTSTNGLRLFRRIPPVNPHLTAKAVARSKSQSNNKKCFLLPSNNQKKPQGGRPEHAYQIPSIAELCMLLGVKPSNSDPLERTDLAAAHQTRMALHRELIKRRPGKYSRRWLANRLGVTIPTISTYNHAIPIHSRSNYLETTMRWDNIERLPLDEPMRGAVLVTTNGKRYPALRTIASILLAKGEVVHLKQQGSNIYWYGNAEPIATLVAEIQEQQAHTQQAVEVFAAPKSQDPLSESFWKYSKPMPKQGKAVQKSHQNFHKPFTDIGQEALAQQVYTTINGMGGKTISLTNARRITLMKSTHHIRMALKLIQKRHTLQNPTGFLITLLRSKYTFEYENTAIQL